MRAAALVVVLALAVLSAPLAAEPTVNVARVGFLTPTDWCPANDTRSEAFLQGLSELGYHLGRNVVFECRAANGRYEQLTPFAAELVLLNVDVIFAVTRLAALAAKAATSTIPHRVRVHCRSGRIPPGRELRSAWRERDRADPRDSGIER